MLRVILLLTLYGILPREVAKEIPYSLSIICIIIWYWAQKLEDWFLSKIEF